MAKTTNLPKPSRLSLGARFSVRADSGRGIGLYLTSEDADVVAKYYGARVVEVDESGIARR